MTAAVPLCPVHKRPGRYVFGSMVICDREDAELKGESTKRADTEPVDPPHPWAGWSPFGFFATVDGELALMRQWMTDEVSRVMLQSPKVPFTESSLRLLEEQVIFTLCRCVADFSVDWEITV